MATAMAHGFAHAASVESTLAVAASALWGFAIVGYVVGSLGEWIVKESVQARIADEIAAEPALPAQP